MLESINITGDVAVYMQIENEIQFAIACGKLGPGDRIPSVRELSERLDVNPNTVAKSYRDLEVMGYVYTRRGMGIFVKKGVEAKCRENVRRRIIGRLHEVFGEAKATGMTVSEVTEVLKKCQDFDTNPYDEAPREVLSLARSGARSSK